MKRTAFILLLLACLLPAFGQWHIDEDFEGITTLPAGWTIHDDGDGMTWRNIYDPDHAHSGSRVAFVDNYLPNQNADWLITPQVNVNAGDSLVFWTRSWISSENLKVFVSTTGTAIGNFSTQILNLQELGTTYQQFSHNLSAYAGQSIYIGFFWECEEYGILVDDVRVGHPLVITPELNLPESFTFNQGESLEVDFTPFIVATELSSTSLSWQPTEHVEVAAQGQTVTFSSPNWAGTETVHFTLQDLISGQTASDNVQVIVNPPPTVDLALTDILSPGAAAFLGSLFTPGVRLYNNGQSVWDNQVRLLMTITDNAGQTISSEELYHAAQLQPAESEDVSFPPVSLGVEGSYSITYLLDLEDEILDNNSISRTFEVILRVSQGGPDAFGYRYIDSTAENGPAFDWIDISATGTSTVMYGVDQWSGDDNFSEPIPLGFDFPFYGNVYTSAYVDTNGEILLEPNNWYEEFPGNGWDSDGNIFNYVYPIPGFAAMPGLIAVYWDDLFVEQGTGDIYFQTFGASPDRYTVIQWHNLRFAAGSGATSLLDFEVILHESGEIVMQYLSTATGQTGSNVPHDNGRSSTVALQNASADIGICYLREIVQNSQYMGVEPPGNLLFDGLAVRFYSGPDEQPPLITHTALGNTFETDLELEARVLDVSPLAQVEVYYSTSETWSNVAGTPSGENNYSFNLPPQTAGNTLKYYIRAQDSLGNTGYLPEDAPGEYFSFQLLPGDNCEVLLAYSGSQDYQRVELPLYQARLDSLNITYDTYNWEEYDSYSFPASYKTILAYASTGGSGVKGETFASALMGFLDQGTVSAPKNLFLASDGWASGQHGHHNDYPQTKLLNGYLRTWYAPTGGGGGTNGLAGPDVYTYVDGTILCRPASPIGVPWEEYPVYANSPDCIFSYETCPDWYADEMPYPEIGAVNAFTFEDGPIDGHAYLYNGVCATAVELPIYKAFYFSFDYSQLTDPQQSAAFLADLMDWFGVETAAQDNLATPPAFALLGNHPNPFNPSTSIKFSLAKASRAELNVYNIKGQKVKTLANSLFQAGNHTLVWDGCSDEGENLASGVYLLRMEAGKFRQTRKMTIMK